MSRKLDEALDKLQKLAGVGAPFSARSGAEARYAQAYQEEVAAGRAPQLPERYRNAGTGKRMPGGHNNSRTASTKGDAHPAIHGFRRKGYRVEARWNPKEKTASVTPGDVADVK